MAEFNVPSVLQEASGPDRLQAVAEFAEALNLDGVTVQMNLHKAFDSKKLEPHYNPAVIELEQEFIDLWDPKGIVNEVLKGIGIKKSLLMKAQSTALYRPDGKPLSDVEIARLKSIIAKALHVDESKVNEILVKAGGIAKVSSVELMGQKVNISMLPKTLQAAIKELGLNALEANSIKFAFQYAAANISKIQAATQTLIQNMIIEGIEQKTGTRALASKMFDELAVDDSSALNRDWDRIAVTEVNNVVNNGFIASQAPGTYVVGHSHHDACIYCLDMINMKIYKVTNNPPEEYSGLNPKSKKYKELAHRWETEVWTGKSNIGRSLSPKKRVNGGLVKRKSHELSTPTITLHPVCRCRWTRWRPELFYIKNGQTEFAIDEESRKEHAEFLKQNPHITIGD